MPRKYGTCSTCGREVVYVSKNFENAGIAISAAESFNEKIIRELKEELAYTNRLLSKKLETLSIQELKTIYMKKVIEEENKTYAYQERMNADIGRIFSQNVNWKR